ncbi:MAG TPA: hypothetical protein VGB04_03925 [Allosphingosinicella sp.]
MTEILGLLLGVSLVLTGAHQMARPAAYVGKGFLDATDPRTVRRFGGAAIVGGGPVFLFYLIRLVQG